MILALRSMFFCLLVCLSFAQKAQKNAFTSLKYDKVIAYDYNGYAGKRIVKDGELFNTKGKILQQKELTKIQIDKLLKTVNSPKTYGGGTAACFDPHFGVVFYSGEKIVAHISVCMACNYLDSSQPIPAMKTHKDPNLCEDCFAQGFSEIGRKQLSELVKELQFSHWELNSELFDK